jgi:hypothetical protein
MACSSVSPVFKSPACLPPSNPFPEPFPESCSFLSLSLSLSPSLVRSCAHTRAVSLSLSLSLSLDCVCTHSRTLALSPRSATDRSTMRCSPTYASDFATLSSAPSAHTSVCLCVCVCVGGGGRAHGIWNGCKVWVLGVCLNVHHNVCAHTPVSRNFFSTSTSSTSSLDMWSMEEGTERPNFWQLRRPDSAHPEPVLRRSSCGGRADASAWAAAGRRLAGAKDTLYDCGAHASSASAARANGPRGSQSRYLCVCSRERHDRNAYKHCVAVPENGDDRNWGARLIS